MGSFKSLGWDASRAIDYFVRNPKIDENRIAVEGYPDMGKPAILIWLSIKEFLLVFLVRLGSRQFFAT